MHLWYLAVWARLWDSFSVLYFFDFSWKCFCMHSWYLAVWARLWACSGPSVFSSSRGIWRCGGSVFACIRGIWPCGRVCGLVRPVPKLLRQTFFRGIFRVLRGVFRGILWPFCIWPSGRGSGPCICGIWPCGRVCGILFPFCIFSIFRGSVFACIRGIWPCGRVCGLVQVHQFFPVVAVFGGAVVEVAHAVVVGFRVGAFVGLFVQFQNFFGKHFFAAFFAFFAAFFVVFFGRFVFGRAGVEVGHAFVVFGRVGAH